MCIKHKFLILLLSVFLFTGCKKYLDQIPDDTLQLDGVFDNADNAMQFLANVYSNVPDEFNQRFVGGSYNSGPWTGASDEAEYDWSFVGSNYMNIGSWDPTTGFVSDFWKDDYVAIRSATFFMQNIDKVPSDQMTDTLKLQYKAEARALRAIYYFYLVRTYGPVPVIGENLIAVDASSGQVQLARTPMDSCISYIASELDAAATVLSVPSIYKNVMNNPNNYGRMTAPICQAFKAQALLLDASPLFNGNTDYAAMKNPDGSQLISQQYDATKWAKAAAAYSAFITQYVPNTFDLYKENDGNGNYSPYLSCRDVFLDNWNKEVIFARAANSAGTMHYDRTPYHSGYQAEVRASGGLGATQRQVDAFFMANGKDITDPTSGYQTTGYSNFQAPGDDAQRSIFNQWVNREPRFYVNITYNGSRWLNTETGDVITTLYYHGNSGRANGNDYCPTGYVVRKAVGLGPWSDGGQIDVLYRLANVYLDYAEALNESDPGNPDILKYLNLIRARAGIPGYGEDGLAVPGSQADMRQAIWHERQVELCFENCRYFDTRRWKIATQTDNGPQYGLNINEDLPEFLTPVPFETRVFTQKNYLFPIPQAEINNDRTNMVQNTGW